MVISKDFRILRLLPWVREHNCCLTGRENTAKLFREERIDTPTLGTRHRERGLEWDKRDKFVLRAIKTTNNGVRH